MEGTTSMVYLSKCYMIKVYCVRGIHLMVEVKSSVRNACWESKLSMHRIGEIIMNKLLVGLLFIVLMIGASGCVKTIEPGSQETKLEPEEAEMTKEVETDEINEDKALVDDTWSAEKDLNGYWAVRPPGATEAMANEYFYNFEVVSDSEIIYEYVDVMKGTYTYDGVNFHIIGTFDEEQASGAVHNITVEITAKFLDNTRTEWHGWLTTKNMKLMGHLIQRIQQI